jgi:endonuclease YncB( thermonuclease family)
VDLAIYQRLCRATFRAIFALSISFMQPGMSEEIIAGQATVIDADTIEIHGQPIRLWGIDAPEGEQLCQREGTFWRCGQFCANALDQHIDPQTVTCAGRGRDRYKRVVAVCSIGGQDIALWLVREGCALDFLRYSKGAYAIQQGEAAVARRGMWQGPVEAPWDWRQRKRRKDRAEE